MAIVSSVVDFGRFAVWLGLIFSLVMVGLVVWYVFNTPKTDAENDASSEG